MIGVKNHHARGFTVVELLVVVLLFSLGALALSATYINFTRLHRRTANAEALGEELRFAMELMVRAARNNTIVYPSLPAAIPNPSSQIDLVARSGAETSFAVLADTDPACSGLLADCLALSLDGGVTWAPITGKNVQIDRFDVYVHPDKNPFQTTGLGAYDNDEQPRVTYNVEARFLATNPREEVRMTVQTAVGSRLYVR